MFYSKTVRSAFALLAVSGMVAACGPTAGNAPHSPAAKTTDGATILSSDEVQRASVSIVSVTDSDGRAVAVESTGVLGILAAADRAVVTKMAVQTEGGAAVERMSIDLADRNGSIVKFEGDTTFTNLVAVTGGIKAVAQATLTEGKITEMVVRLEDGRTLDVVVAFGEEQDQGKQDQGKQDQGKQDQGKQDQGKQDQGKQDQGKQDQGKQDQGKQDQGKQDQGKQDQGKQDQGKQDQGKQDQGKQDQGKQDQGKQDQGKQDQGKQDQGKQDQGKQDQGKQDQGKQDQA